MSGFENDVISILKTENFLHREAIGFIVDSGNLLDELYKRNLPVTGIVNGIDKFDYIVLPSNRVNVRRLFRVLSELRNDGIIILELTGLKDEHQFQKKYVSMFAGFIATKVRYEERTYMVIHSGVDYGN